MVDYSWNERWEVTSAIEAMAVITLRVAELLANGSVWYLTQCQSEKVEEIETYASTWGIPWSEAAFKDHVETLEGHMSDYMEYHYSIC